jgi:hypothetical protein
VYDAGRQVFFLIGGRDLVARSWRPHCRSTTRVNDPFRKAACPAGGRSGIRAEQAILGA